LFNSAGLVGSSAQGYQLACTSQTNRLSLLSM